MEKFIAFLAGLPMTLLGGICLCLSLYLEFSGMKCAVDPAWVTIIVSGLPLLYLSIIRLIKNTGMKKISSALLITIAMFAAIFIGDIFAAGEVAFIMAIGAILEEKTTERAQKGLRKLLELVPKKGRKLVGDKEFFVNAEDIIIGDTLRVLPGETIPADGRIISGSTSVDQAILTGESLPVDKNKGDNVWCGTINRFGAIDMEVSKTSANSSLQQMIRLVKEAEKSKAPMERIADTWASWLVPVALLIAIITGFGTNSIERAVTILVVFCPCALVLATPTAVMAAIGQATRHGVIIKNGDALERMGKVNMVAFDKTGTLTYGILSVSDVLVMDNDMNEQTLLSYTASVEKLSGHPLAKAIVAYAKSRDIPILEVNDFKMVPGQGISAVINGKSVLCGNIDWLIIHNTSIMPESSEKADTLRKEGKAAIYVAIGERLAGMIGLSDTTRDETPDMVSSLERENVGVVLLTGDNEATAIHLARLAGISSVYSSLLPAGKLDKIHELQAKGKMVCMIGDGVNDAPALKAANVGVAMGTIGTDIAIEAADIALVGDDISLIPYLKKLSNATVFTIRLCISLSLVINFVAIILSIYGLLNPTTGALVHNAGSVMVVLIAALLYDRNFMENKKTMLEKDKEILSFDPA